MSKRLKKPKLNKLKIKKFSRKNKVTPVANTGSGVESRITSETIAAHREEVIGGARKYIYPLQHSKHRIILITTSLLIAGLIGFFTYCTLALYKFQSTSAFVYRVTQVVPFPVARTGGSFVSYESYLFEVRRYTHYYESQLKLDFRTTEGQQQLAAFKKQTLDKVVNDAYVKKLASKYNITVTEQQLDEQIAILRNQNRLGSNDEVFEDVLRLYWGWSVNDFKRSLRSQILAQNVAAKLDTETVAEANKAHAELVVGADFGAVAKQYSDDPSSKDNGGDIGNVAQTNRDLLSQTVDALYKLKPGEFSEVINIGYALEIVKNIENTPDGKIHAAHILFNFKDISTYINDLKDEQKTQSYIKN